MARIIGLLFLFSCISWTQTQAAVFLDSDFVKITDASGTSRSFFIQQAETTQAQWFEVMGSNPSYFKFEEDCHEDFLVVEGDSLCPNNPVEKISWDVVQSFISKLNELEKDRHYRLPTEAEWEIAARAGTTGLRFFGDDLAELGKYAWFYGNSGGQTHSNQVAKRAPNQFGLYDMYGNVWEWVEDWYDTTNTKKVVRGGAWSSNAENCSSNLRGKYRHDAAIHFIGFRLATD